MPPSRKIPTKFFCNHTECTNTGGFLRPADLERHAWTHVAKTEWPHHCEYCGKAYIQPSNLNAHIRVHHTKEQPYSCDFCNEKFYAAYQKSMHLKEHQATTTRHVRTTTHVSYKRRLTPYVHCGVAMKPLPLLESPSRDPLIKSESPPLEPELLPSATRPLSDRPLYYPPFTPDKLQQDWMQTWIASLETPYPSPPQSLRSSPPASVAPEPLQSSRGSPLSAPSPSPSLSVGDEMNSLLCAKDLEAVHPTPSLFLNTDHYFGLSESTSLWDRIPGMDFQSGDFLNLGVPQFSDMPIY